MCMLVSWWKIHPYRRSRWSRFDMVNDGIDDCCEVSRASVLGDSRRVRSLEVRRPKLSLWQRWRGLSTLALGFQRRHVASTKGCESICLRDDDVPEDFSPSNSHRPLYGSDVVYHPVLQEHFTERKPRRQQQVGWDLILTSQPRQMMKWRLDIQWSQKRELRYSHQYWYVYLKQQRRCITIVNTLTVKKYRSRSALLASIHRRCHYHKLQDGSHPNME